VTDTVIGPHTTALLSVTLENIGTELVVDKTTESNRVTEELEWGNDGTPDHHRGGNKEDILENTAEGEDEGGSLANQEDNGNVEEEGSHSVGKENPETDIVNLNHLHLWNLPDESNAEVHDGADWSKVVEGNQWVHLVFGRGEEALDHDETNGLEHDTTGLEEESDEHKLDLSEGGDDDTDDNEGDIEENLEVWLRDTEGPGGNQNGDWSSGLHESDSATNVHKDSGGKSYLEHLDEGNAQVEVSQVTADQAQTEEETDWDNGAEIDTARHLNRLTTIEESCSASHDLGHDGRKGQMPCSEDNRVVWRNCQWAGPWMCRALGLGLRNLAVSRIHLLKRMTLELRVIQTLCFLKVSSQRSERWGFVTLRISTYMT
jgi:hypothetical protein